MVETLQTALKRGFMSLDDECFEKADIFFEQALNIDPENTQAYIGKLLAELRVRTESELDNCIEPFIYSDNYKKILAFGDDNTILRFQNYNNEIIYKNAVEKMNSATTPTEYKSASNIFKNISSYKDSAELKIECDNKSIYFAALKDEQEDKVFSLNRAISRYSEIIDYQDSANRICACKKRIEILEKISELEKQEQEKQRKKIAEKSLKQKNRLKMISIICATVTTILIIAAILIQSVFVPNSKYNKAIEFYNNGKYTEAMAIFEELNTYKDSTTLVKDCKYNKAIELYNNVKYAEAIVIFEELNTYKDSATRIKDCKYKIAASLYNDGDFFEAAKTFYSIIDYSDSKGKCYSAWSNITQTKFSIANGTDLILGLKTDGSVIADGVNNYGQANVSNWNNIISITCSGSHSVGLKTDGTVVATGLNEDGQCNVEEWSDIIAISANENTTVGLKSDGTCIATGDNKYGQCDVSEWRDIVNISTSGLHTVGLKADGTLVATGRNNNGECNVSEFKDIVGISVGYDITAAINYSGYVVTAGRDNEYINKWYTVKTISFYSDSNCIAIKTLDNRVTCVHSSFYSSLDKDDFDQDFNEFTNLVDVAAGYQLMIGLKEDGTVVQAGELDYVSFDGDTICVKNPSSEWSNILVRK